MRIGGRLLEVGFTLAYELASAASSAFIFQEAVDFIKGVEKQDENEPLGVTAWFTFAAGAVTAIPMTITMLHYWARKRHLHEQQGQHHGTGDHDFSHDAVENSHCDYSTTDFAGMDDSPFSVKSNNSEYAIQSDQDAMAITKAMAGAVVVHTDGQSIVTSAQIDEYLVRTDDEDSIGHDAHHGHHHGALTEFKEYLIIGVPFGVLGGGSTFLFLQKILDKSQSRGLAGIITLSAAAGLAASWGNYQLHEVSFHAPEGARYWDLFARLPGMKKKAIALWFTGGVLVGHFAEGFLDALPLVRALNGGPWVELVLGSIVGSIIAFFEGSTELQNTLWQMLPKQSGTPRLSCCNKFGLSTSSSMHGFSPSTGFTSFTRLLFNFITAKILTAEMPMEWRCVFLTGSLVLIGVPNGVGFFSTVRNSTGLALKKAGSAIVHCPYAFLTKLGYNRGERQRLVVEGELTPTTPSVNSPSVN